jgi:hypothetical protein
MDSDQVYLKRANGPAALAAAGRRLGYGGLATMLAGDELALAVAVCQHESSCLVTVHYRMAGLRAPAWTTAHPPYLLAPVVSFDPGRAGAQPLVRSPFAGELPALPRWRGPGAPDWSTAWPLYALVRCLETGYAPGLACFSIGLNQIQLGAHIGGGRIPTFMSPWPKAIDFANWWKSDSDNYDAVINLAFGYMQACFRGPSGRLPPFTIGEPRSTTVQRVIMQTGGGPSVANRFLDQLTVNRV